MYLNKKLAIGLLSSCLLVTSAYADNCLTGTITTPSNTYWTPATLTITNTCNTAQNLDQDQVSFISKNSNGDPALGVQQMYGWPNGSSAFTYKGDVATATLNGSIPANGTATLSFGVGNLGDYSFDYQTAQQSLTIGNNGPSPKKDGEIDVIVNPAGAGGFIKKDLILVQGSQESDVHTIKVENLSTTRTYVIKDLPHDGYNISVESPEDQPDIQGAADPKFLNVDSATPMSTHVSFTSQPKPSDCFSGTISSTDNSAKSYYINTTLNITNNCDSAQSIDQKKVTFTSQQDPTNPKQQPKLATAQAMWGWPYKSTDFSFDGNKAITTLQGSPTIAPHQTITLNFGISKHGGDAATDPGTPFQLGEANSTLTIGNSHPHPTPTPLNDGIIKVAVNTSGVPTNTTAPDKIEIQGDKQAQPIVFTVTNWSNPSQIQHFEKIALPHDKYTVTVDPVADDLGYAQPARFTISNSNPQNITVTYQEKPAVGLLQLNLGSAPMTNAAGPVNVEVKDPAAKLDWSKQVNWNDHVLLKDLPAGTDNKYTVTMQPVTNGIQTAQPATVWHPVIVKNVVTPVNLSFAPPINNPTQTVTFDLKGLPSETTATLNIQDIYNNLFSKSKLRDGDTTEQLPIGDTFTVNAVAQSLSAHINPQTFTLSENTTPPTVKVQFSNQPPVPATFEAFADSGTQSNFDSGSTPAMSVGLVPPTGGNLTEGFGLWNNMNAGPGHTDLWGIPGAFHGDTPSLTSNYLHDHAAQNKGFLSIGGQGMGYGYPWDKETVAQGVQDIETLVKYYQFEGVDFDVEGAAIDIPADQQWVANVAYDLRKDNPNLILSLTVPDPVIYDNNMDVNHIYAYTSGATALIQDTLKENNNKMVFNFVNKMAFDLSGHGGDCSQTIDDMSNDPTTGLGKNCLIMSAQAADIQLARMLNTSTSNAWQYVGEILMPPIDDQGKTLSPQLATDVANKLHQLGVNHLGYWNVQKDYAWTLANGASNTTLCGNNQLCYGDIFTQALGLSSNSATG